MAQILVFGDSITYGAWDKDGGWVQRLRKAIDKKILPSFNSYHLVYNLGISGDTTTDLLERFELETKARTNPEEENVIIFDIGGNDTVFIKNNNSLKTTLPKFRNNVQKLINIASKYSKKILFIGLIPADENKTIPVSWNKDVSYKNEYLSRYNSEIKNICKENHLGFIDNFEMWISSDYKRLLLDGLHPNDRGHKIIFWEIKKYLMENNWI